LSGRDRRHGLEMEMGFDLARLRRSLMESSSRGRGRGREGEPILRMLGEIKTERDLAKREEGQMKSACPE